jgi:predicted TIM-barrel fold metal-dependent hydrolase
MRPPFRVEHVGSFLRPERLIQAARDRKAGKIGDAEVKRLQDECVREIERCAAKGFRAVNFTGEPQVFGFPFLGESYWDPFWAAACDHDMVVSFHIGSGELNWNHKRVEKRGFTEEYALQSVHLWRCLNRRSRMRFEGRAA